MRRKDFRRPIDVIMIYTKQSMLSAGDNSEMAVTGTEMASAVRLFFRGVGDTISLKKTYGVKLFNSIVLFL